MRNERPVDPTTGAEPLAGAQFLPDKLQGDRIVLADGTTFVESPNRWRKADEVARLIRRTPDVLLLFVTEPWGNSPIDNLGLPSPTEAWRQRLKAQYLLDDGSDPKGYDHTALLARLWQAPGRTALVFEVSC